MRKFAILAHSTFAWHAGLDVSTCMGKQQVYRLAFLVCSQAGLQRDLLHS